MSPCIVGELAALRIASLKPCEWCGGDVLRPSTRSGECHVYREADVCPECSPDGEPHPRTGATQCVRCGLRLPAL
ncbi:hypothetical protein SEA_ZETA1847_36 [Microbacterium phage Zeta1847]|uniref:Uncharacterized protein n=1 Tax=Microbacterium phage Zeta1847 TaxID=2201444 RepID=A0A2Z4Q9L3_9CAUD|nr:hypothetical protein HOT46_gp36 [Microbacterium phage Zeta1847]AWY06670.1 hypothetical protein SEA_ZETA1847_36 [Microbacterium phage Zeta1847]